MCIPTAERKAMIAIDGLDIDTSARVVATSARVVIAVLMPLHIIVCAPVPGRLRPVPRWCVASICYECFVDSARVRSYADDKRTCTPWQAIAQ